MIRLATFILSIIFLTSCLNNKKDLILDYLNKYEKKFNKDKYEFIELELLDTIFENNTYKYWHYNNFPSPNLPQNTAVIESVILEDGTDLEYFYVKNDKYLPTDVQPKYYPFSLNFYNHLRYNSNYTWYNNYDDSSNTFLDSIVHMKYEDFKMKLLNNSDFQTRLNNEISNYEHFKGLFSSDSLSKNIISEKKTPKILFGYLYRLKYRVNSILFEKMIIYNSDYSSIIGHL